MDQRNIQIDDTLALEQKVYRNLDVRSMNREQLLHFLHDYIQKNQYLNKRNNLINARLIENNSKRLKRLEELKNKFNIF